MADVIALGFGVRPGFGSVFGLVDVVVQFPLRLEPGAENIAREEQMRRPWNPGLHLPERFGGVLPDAVGGQDGLAPLRHAGGHPLVAPGAGHHSLPSPGILVGDSPAAAQDQDGRTGAVRDHEGGHAHRQATAPLCVDRRNLTGNTVEGIAGMTHVSVMPAAVRRDAGLRQRILDGVVAGTVDEGREPLGLAALREHIGGRHRPRVLRQRRRPGRLELGRQPDIRIGGSRGRFAHETGRADRSHCGGRTRAHTGLLQEPPSRHRRLPAGHETPPSGSSPLRRAAPQAGMVPALLGQR